jgi:hypothetical protein
MSSRYRRNCLNCGNHDSIVGPISWRGNCEACGLERMIQNAAELHIKRGPMYRRWRRNILAGLERQPLDDVQANP